MITNYNFLGSLNVYLTLDFKDFVGLIKMCIS